MTVPKEHPWVNDEEVRLIREAHRDNTLASGQPRPPAVPSTSAAVIRNSLPVARPLWHAGLLDVDGAGDLPDVLLQFPHVVVPHVSRARHGVKLTSAGLMTMVPLAGVVAGATGGGMLFTRLLRRDGIETV